MAGVDVSTPAPQESLDLETFTQMAEAEIGLAYRVAMGMLGAKDRADDAVQDALVAAWQKRDQLRERTAFRPWLLKIVTNRCRLDNRSRWRQVLLLGLQPVDNGSTLAFASADIDLGRALLGLPANIRATVLLRFFADLSLEEVAKATGAPVGTVKSRLNRALLRLRPLLDEGNNDV
jgi:RNA polymerase sigma factor (sigma-70 family)